jgi:hypothetical protein
VKWVDDLVAYLGEGRYLADPPGDPSQPSKNTAMRLIWITAPYTLSPAHSGTDYVTTVRHRTYDDYATRKMRDIGVPVVDSARITKSMWEFAYDGLHYLKGANDNWYGSVSVMVFQATLNVVFPGCGEAK